MDLAGFRREQAHHHWISPDLATSEEKDKEGVAWERGVATAAARTTRLASWLPWSSGWTTRSTSSSSVHHGGGDRRRASLCHRSRGAGRRRHARAGEPHVAGEEDADEPTRRPEERKFGTGREGGRAAGSIWIEISGREGIMERKVGGIGGFGSRRVGVYRGVGLSLLPKLTPI